MGLFGSAGNVAGGAVTGGILGGPAGAAIGGGLSILGNVASDLFQGAQNKRQRQFAIDMYNKQRTDALADWNMQNAYNSPQAQMERLKAAGLNPNLVYGNGTVGNSTSQPRGSSPQSWNPRPINVGAIGDTVGTYFDTMIKEQQYNNMKKSNDLMDIEMALKGAMTGKNIAATAKDKFTVDQGKALLAPSIELIQERIKQMAAQITKTQADTQFTLDANQRAQLMTSANFSQAVENIALMKANQARSQADTQRIYQAIDNMKKSGELLDWQVQLSKRGITPGDPLYMRAAAALLNQLTAPQVPGQKSEGGWNDFNDWLNHATGGALDFR